MQDGKSSFKSVITGLFQLSIDAVGPDVLASFRTLSHSKTGGGITAKTRVTAVAASFKVFATLPETPEY
jgi:hypothetical protein